MKLTNTPTDQPTTKSTRGRKPTGRIRNKLLQIRLSDTEHQQITDFTTKNNTDANKLLREMLIQLTTLPDLKESVMIKVKGRLMYLTKSEAKKLLIDLTSQI